MVPAATYLHLLLYEITYQTPSMRAGSRIVHFIPILLHYISVYVDYACPSHTLLCYFFAVYHLSSPFSLLFGWEHVAYPPILLYLFYGIPVNKSTAFSRIAWLLYGERAQNACDHGNTYTLLFKTIRDDGKITHKHEV